MVQESCEYIHRELGETITAIGGHYALTREERLAYKGREVLYLVGYALMDTTCCGAAGCGYAQVQGFVEKWRYNIAPDGSAMTRIVLIQDEPEQAQIARLIQEKELVQQVIFRMAFGFGYL
jgi:hypothetical protein